MVFIKRVSTRFKGPHHSFDCLGKQSFYHRLQQPRIKLKINVKVDFTAIRMVEKPPVIGEMLERAFGIADGDHKIVIVKLYKEVKRSRNILKPIISSAVSAVFVSHAYVPPDTMAEIQDIYEHRRPDRKDLAADAE